MARRPSIVVFTGPTISAGKAAAILDATYVQPASQGDIVLAAHAFRPDLMILIDGTFQGCPAVRHKEILWAMAQGITVLGAASMGAIRAAELHPFGMIGVGAIYRWYRRWALAPDDAVAIQCGPYETGYIKLTDSLIDVQASISNLSRKGLINRRERLGILAKARETHFRKRQFKNILFESGFPEDRINDCLKHGIEMKRSDAIKALRYGVEFCQFNNFEKRRDFVPTHSFIRDLIDSGIDTKYLHTYPDG